MSAEGDAGGAGGAAGGAGAGAGSAGGAAGGGAAGGGAGGAGAGGSSSPAGGQAPGSGAAPPGAYRPEGLPDHFAGASDRETIDRLWKAADGFRREAGDRGAVPKAPTEYAFDASEKLKPYVGGFDKDPVWAKTREIAHAAGLTDKQFKGFVAPLLEHLVEGNLVSAPIDANAELLKLAPPAQYADDKERLAAGARHLNDNIAWVDGAKAQQTMPADVAEYLAAALPDQVGANRVVDWLRGRDSRQGPALGGGAGGGGVTAAQLSERANDPRGNPNKPEFDRAFAAETDRLYKQHYGS